MAALNANAYYRESQITTASRGQLLLMTYDSALRSLAEAKCAMIEKRYEAKNKSLLRVQEILLVLVSTLDHSVSPELAENLDRLYRYMYDQLTIANIHDNVQLLNNTSMFLTDLRAAWAEADLQLRRQEASLPLGKQVG